MRLYAFLSPLKAWRGEKKRDWIFCITLRHVTCAVVYLSDFWNKRLYETSQVDSLVGFLLLYHFLRALIRLYVFQSPLEAWGGEKREDLIPCFTRCQSLYLYCNLEEGDSILGFARSHVACTTV